jgi:hypothetical protein
MDPFVDLFQDVLIEAGLELANIHRARRVDVVLPGFFRATKEWDLLAVREGNLVAALEVKSQAGSFGNNFNNRVEEALGSAVDLWTAFREGRFNTGAEPWLGWLMVLEDCPASRSAVDIKEPHFKVFPEFAGSSYARRYELFCRKLIRERHYRSAALVLTNRESGKRGEYSEPSSDISVQSLVQSLSAHVNGWLR